VEEKAVSYVEALVIAGRISGLQLTS